MKITFLGTGTSDGIPMIGCHCAICSSKNPKNRRMRTSLLLEAADDTHLLFDVSPDFHEQALTHQIEKLDAIFVTHAHYDHTAGLPELRRYNFLMNKLDIPLYANKPTLNELKQEYHYFFDDTIQKGGGIASLKFLEFTKPLELKDLTITPIPVKHGSLDILGYRVNNFAFLTDVSYIPDESFAKLQNLDLLVLSALRYREHSTHFNIAQSIVAAQKIGAGKTFFMHFTHDVEHEKFAKELPPSMAPAYDGLIVDF